MSNAYGFDFLRTEHLDESAQEDVARLQEKSAAAAQKDDDDDEEEEEEDGGLSGSFFSDEKLFEIQNKPDLEKQFDVLDFLRNHRSSGLLSSSVIYKSTGIDLDVDVKVAEMLQKNPKVKVEMVPDPENPALSVAMYAYQAKYSTVRDRTSLLAQINRMVSGVPMRDLEDSYAEVKEDLKSLITAGDIVAISNTEDKDKILFPRGDAFLVELDGIVSLPQHVSKVPPEAQKLYVIETDVDPTTQIRRGEAVLVGGEWFRVSSATRPGVSLEEQPARAQAPLSVVSMTDLSKRNEVDGYVRPFNSKSLPLDMPLSLAGIQNLKDAKEARERLVKAAHGARISSGGGGGSLGVLVGQALGSLAHSSNPTALGKSAASSAGPALGGSSSLVKRRQTNKNAPSGEATLGGFAKGELIKAASDITLATYSHAWRHGCTKDIREMYLETRSLVPESDADLHALLVEHKLLEPNEQMRRDRLKRGNGANLDSDGKPRKRRYYERKNQRMTNMHLDNTPEGAVLALALEQQKQGKSVGDGGM